MLTGESIEAKTVKRISSGACFVFPALIFLNGLAAAQLAFRIGFDRGAQSAPGMIRGIEFNPASIPEVPPARRAGGQDEAPITVPALPAGTDKRFVKSFNAGVTNAVRRLREPGCSAFFGSGAEQRLVNTTYRFVPMGAPAVNEYGAVKVTGAATFHDPDAVFINSQGPFMSPLMYVPGKSGFQTVDMGTNLRGADFSALLLLHELGHIVGNFGPDAADPALNLSNTRAVLKNCF